MFNLGETNVYQTLTRQQKHLHQTGILSLYHIQEAAAVERDVQDITHGGGKYSHLNRVKTFPRKFLWRN